MIRLFQINLPFEDPVLVFSLMLLIILLSPLVLRKLRIPSIIGLIIAGIACGPFGFNLLLRNESIELLGTVGLLYIMFLAGLELDLNEFKRNQKKSILFGLLTFIIPGSVGFFLCNNILEMDIFASILISLIFSTQTLISYPIASRLGIIKNESVTMVIGGTIITDTLVLIGLSFTTTVLSNENFIWINKILSLVLLYFAIVGILPLLTRWFFKNIEGEKTSQYLFVMAMTFLSAFAATLIGFESIIGAFFAGLALNRIVSTSSALMNKIEFIGNAIFIPVFLIGLGMLIDLNVLFNDPNTIIYAVLFSSLGLFTKWLAAFVTQKILGFSSIHRKVIWGLSTSHAAATIAILLIGFKYGVINETILNSMIIFILITCFIGSFVTENAGRKLAIIESSKIPKLTALPEKIMVHVTRPDTIEDLIDLSVLIKDHRNPLPIYALMVVEDTADARDKVAISRKMLEKAQNHAAASDNKVDIITRIELNQASGIIKTMNERNISEIVMDWYEKNKTTDLIFDNTLGHFLQNSDQMVFVTRIVKPLITLKNIVVIIPANAELEIGFTRWLNKIRNILKYSSVQSIFYCSLKTAEKCKENLYKSRYEINVKYKTSIWEDLSILSNEVGKDDLVIFINARKATISYNSSLDLISTDAPKYFKNNNIIIIYPEQNPALKSESPITIDVIDGSPLEEISKIGKTVKKILGIKEE